MRGADGSSSCVADRNRSRRRANRHGRGHEFGIQHRERRANPVERHRSRSDEMAAANQHLRASRATDRRERRNTRCGRRQAGIEHPHRTGRLLTSADSSSESGRAIDLPVCALNYASLRDGAVCALELKIVDDSARTGRQSKHRAILLTAFSEGSPQISIGALDGSANPEINCERAHCREFMKGAARRIDLIKLRLIERIAAQRSVEFAVRGLKQAARRAGWKKAIGEGERGEARELAAQREAEHDRSRSSINVAVRALDQPSGRKTLARPVEGQQGSQF